MSIHIHTYTTIYLCMYICAYKLYMYTCVCEYVFTPLIDEAIFQVIKSNRIYSTGIAVTTTERSYGEQTTIMLRTSKTLIHS